MSPAHIQAMMDAYVAETGIRVRMNWARQSSLWWSFSLAVKLYL